MFVKISFADEGLRTHINQAIIYDLLKAVDSASRNLKDRYGIILSVVARHHYENSIIVSLKSEFQDADEFIINNVGYRLKGIASYLLHKSCNKDLYAKCTVGTRLLSFNLVPNQSTIQQAEQFSDVIITANDAYNIILKNKDAAMKAELMSINYRICEASKHGYSEIIDFATMDEVIDILKNKGYSITQMPPTLFNDRYDYKISWKKGE